MKLRVKIETDGYHTVLDTEYDAKDTSVQEALVEQVLLVLHEAAAHQKEVK